MIFDPVLWLPDGTATQAEQAMAELVARGARALMLFAGENAALDPEGMDPILRRQVLPVFGGVFPKVIHADCYSSSGVVVVGLEQEPQVCEVVSLDAKHARGLRADGLWNADVRPESVMIWVDGLANHLSGLVEAAYDVFGGGPSYIGGAAGSWRTDRRNCLFSNQGMLRDAALILGFPYRIGVGIEHGWQAVSEPFLVSDSVGNWIRTLNYRSAFEVYRFVVEPLAGITISEHNLLEVSKGFPFGLDRMDGLVVVREPILLREGGLVCVGDVPSQTIVHVLRGDASSLHKAVRGGSSVALNRMASPLAMAMMVSCIAREVFLGKAYPQEIAIVRSVLDAGDHPSVPLFGVLSLGEIANPGNRCLELFSKTFVLGLLPHALA